MLEAIQRSAGKTQLQVVAVNIEDRQQFRKLSRALSDFTMTVAHDALGESSKAYGRTGIPHLIIVGRDGRVQTVKIGYNEQGLDAIIAEVNAALVAK